MQDNKDKIIEGINNRIKIYKIFIIIQIIVMICLITYIIVVKQEQHYVTVPLYSKLDAFNDKFESFRGENVTGMKVNSLIQTILAANKLEQTQDTGYKVKTVVIKSLHTYSDAESRVIVNDGKLVNQENVRVNPAYTYSIDFEYDDSGYINKCIIVENDNVREEGNGI